MDKLADNKAVKAARYRELGIKDPAARLKFLSNYASNVDVHHNILPQRYYRSGMEMIKMAEMCIDEGNFEYAYILYVKFITIFVEKITEHPLYNTVQSTDKAKNRQILHEVIDKAEDLKKRLLLQYQAELDKHLEDENERGKAEKERLTRDKEQRLKENDESKNKLALAAATNASAVVPTLSAKEYTEEAYPPVSSKTVVPSTIDSKALFWKDAKIPIVDRSTKPSLLMSDDHGLRDIVLPNKLIQRFLSLASYNTMNNVETCGILGGKLERNKLLVTHLIIPDQSGTPDSCTARNEEDIFDYQDRHNLITLGWIHTHPTQTAFLSSMDLHTHCSYQLMMVEAIAIVCAPRYDVNAVFILTPEYGLDYVANCKETGFHPHPTNPPLYTRAKHCKLDSVAAVTVVDLRRK